MSTFDQREDPFRNALSMKRSCSFAPKRRNKLPASGGRKAGKTGAEAQATRRLSQRK
jgi:hypothetical protein